MTALPGSSLPQLSPVASAHPGWAVVADSEETAQQDGAARNVIDGDPRTIWHSRWTGGDAPLPHVLTLDTGSSGPVAGVRLLPRPADTGKDGIIGQFRVETSVDGKWWRTVASGVLADTSGEKSVQFAPVTARYVKLTALSEAGGRGPWSSLAELNLITTAPAAPQPGTGSWSLPINLPLVPVAAAMLPTGKVLVWSSYKPDAYTVDDGLTQTAVYDPTTGVMGLRKVTSTGHDMFCPGTALLPGGALLVNGGSTSDKTSLYDPGTDTWSVGAPLVIRRGYQAAVTTSSGAVFTLGGSWWDRAGGKNGELWTKAGGSKLLPADPVAPILTQDPQGVYRQDNHPWLFAWSGGKVFHAGPSQAMGWYGTRGSGAYTAAGTRAADGDAMNGSAVMYDIGKILTVGGAPAYMNSVATNHAYAIDLTKKATVRTLSPMASARAFATGVVLPDGKVLVVGGQAYALPYSDATSAMQPELWDPVTEKFTKMAPMAVPRNYHSVALLLADGRVLAGGGGLCDGCGTDHPDVEIFTPPYLLDAGGRLRTRPLITSAPTQAQAGAEISVRTGRPVSSFSLVRMASVTHSVNTDQRRVPLRVVRSSGSTYDLALPVDAGVLVPGGYMLFALDAQGTPSISRTIQIR
jgi:galactose oxidase